MSSKSLAVSVRDLSKAYTISHNAQHHTTLGEAMLHRLRHPIQKVDKETFWALRDINFDVQQGEVIGIIGKNGAGKSTLLKILSQITEPTKGKINLYGRVGSLLEVGTGFHPELTGRENIYLNGAIIGMQKREIDKQFDEIVDFAGVEQFLDTPVKRYSSGMYVRLAFAVAAHLNSEILIIDEVLAVGDAEFQDKCLGKMKDVSNSGRTVLFVSHNMNAVRALCSRVVGLTSGQCTYIGETDEGVKQYLSRTFSSEQRIQDFQEKPNKAIEIESITVNGSPKHILPLSYPDFELDIRITGHLHQSLKMDLEALLCDSFNTPLAFYGRAFVTGTSQSRPEGPFEIHQKITLPSNVFSGTYNLNLMLSHHNTCAHAYFPQGLQLVVRGQTNPAGLALRYNDGKGLVMLEEVN